MSLEDFRQRIDEVDRELVRLLNERTQVVLEVGAYKRSNHEATYVPAREKAVLDKVCKLNEGPLKPDSLRAIYREIMSASLSLERNVRIAYLGPMATFTHQAARSRFGGSVEYDPCETITDVFASVEKGACEYGVVPIENSTEGAVTHTFDELVNTSLKIVAEIYLPITHNLLSTETSFKSIKRVYSNPQVFGQSRRWLQAHLPGVDLIATSSTARAAEQAAGESGSAALASLLAAELRGLTVLARDIQDSGENTTRFLVLGRTGGQSTGDDRTSICFSLGHASGTLFGALSSFKEHGINMTRIESRPSRRRAWEYLFFVDFEGHAQDADVSEALEHLRQHCAELRILGSYPLAAIPGQEESIS